MHVIYFSDPAPAAQQSPSIPGPPPPPDPVPEPLGGVRVTDPGGETRGTAPHSTRTHVARTSGKGFVLHRGATLMAPDVICVTLSRRVGVDLRAL